MNREQIALQRREVTLQETATSLNFNSKMMKDISEDMSNDAIYGASKLCEDIDKNEWRVRRKRRMSGVEAALSVIENMDWQLKEITDNTMREMKDKFQQV